MGLWITVGAMLFVSAPVTIVTGTARLLSGYWDSNLGPYAFPGSTLSTEPSSPPLHRGFQHLCKECSRLFPFPSLRNRTPRLLESKAPAPGHALRKKLNQNWSDWSLSQQSRGSYPAPKSTGIG